jgi:hypothetical protein
VTSTIVASDRVHFRPVLEPDMKPLNRLISLVALAGALLPGVADAQITLTQRGCQTYASWSGNLVWARDLGADKEKARAELVMLDKKTPSNIYALMLRNLDSLWTTTADWESVTLVLLQDCINRRGAYEAGT